MEHKWNTEHNTQHALLKMIGTWRAMLNKGNIVGVIIMDFSKAFDKLNHNLLLWKLKAYGFNKNALTFIQSYFTNRHQRAKVGNKFSKWQNPDKCHFLTVGFNKPFPDFPFENAIIKTLPRKRFLG